MGWGAGEQQVYAVVTLLPRSVDAFHVRILHFWGLFDELRTYGAVADKEAADFTTTQFLPRAFAM